LNRPYRGRFAPSPTGALHRGSLVAALASWLDARAHGGAWLVRIEDIDPPRHRPGAELRQLQCLARFGMVPDEPVLRQSSRGPAYEAALQRLTRAGLVYTCSCSRSAIAARDPASRARYPGTCRGRPAGGAGAQRFRVPEGLTTMRDRALGEIAQDVQAEVGDFVLRRSDGLWAYQLAVVVDDAWQGISDVVRGADLLDNTPRQIALQRALGLPVPNHLHVPLVTDATGRKLSKEDEDAPLESADPLGELERALRHLGFEATGAADLAGFQRHAIAAWRARHGAAIAIS